MEKQPYNTINLYSSSQKIKIKNETLRRDCTLHPFSARLMYYTKSAHCLGRNINQLCATRNLQSSADNGCKITRITLYKVDLPLHERSYKWSGGNYVTSFDATV